MYKEVETKKEYLDLMEDMLTETGRLIIRFPQIGIYKSIFNQLQDIKKIMQKQHLDHKLCS